MPGFQSATIHFARVLAGDAAAGHRPALRECGESGSRSIVGLGRIIFVTDENSNAPSPPPHKRRVRYSGKNPRRFEEKYKEHGRDDATLAKVLASGKTPAGTHRPIMVAEILAALAPQPGELAVDCTLGYGGHTQEILAKILPGGKLLGLDADPIELPKTEARLRALGFDEKVFTAHRSNFAGLPQVLAAHFSSLSSTEGGEGWGEEANTCETNSPSPSPLPAWAGRGSKD